MNSLNLVLPTRKKILKALAKVFPIPRFRLTENVKIEKGIDLLTGREVEASRVTVTVELTYRPKGHKEDSPICSAEIPPEGNVIGAMHALAVAAFKSLGFSAKWDPKFPGRYVFEAIPDFQGPEKLIPAEMDPTVTSDAEAAAMIAQTLQPENPAEVKIENTPADALKN